MSVLTAVLGLVLASQGHARADYPDKPIRLVLPFPAGGAVDIVARTFAAKMADDLGKPIVIENKAGADGIIATDTVAKAPAGTPQAIIDKLAAASAKAARARYRQTPAARRCRAGRWHAVGTGNLDRPRTATVARTYQSGQYQAAVIPAWTFPRTGRPLHAEADPRP